MADQPTNDADAATVEGSSPPAPASAPTPAPVPQTAADAGMAALTRDDPILLEKEDGTKEAVTLGDLVDAHRDQVPKEDKETLALLKRVNAGETDAVKEWIDRFMPASTVPVSETSPPQSSEELQKIREELAEMKVTLARVAPVADQVSQQAGLQRIKNVLDQRKEEFPLSNLHPQGAEFVDRQKKALITEASQRYADDPTWKSLTREKQQEVLVAIEEESLKRVEGWLKDMAKNLGSAMPAASVPADNGSPLPTHRAAPWKFDPKTGRFGHQNVDPAAASLNAEPSPSPEPVSVPSGTAVGVEGAEEDGTGKPMTVEEFRQKSKNRARDRGLIV